MKKSTKRTNRERSPVEPSERAKAKFIELKQQLRGFPAADRVWQQMLTAADRRKLGRDLDDACNRHGGGVGMWMKLHRVIETRALAEVGFRIGLIDMPTRDWLLQEIRNDSGRRRQPRPKWDKISGELRYREKLVRRVRRMESETRVVQILNRFQTAGWPRSIKTPQDIREGSEEPSAWGQQTVHQAIRSLNSTLSDIRFHACGGAGTIYWAEK